MGKGGFHYLKIRIQEPPPHGTPSNTSPSNTAKTQKTGGRNPGPLFFHTLQRPTPAPPSKAHAPQGIRATQSPRGPVFRACQPIGGGLHGANQPLAPPYAKAPTTVHLPYVAGHPFPNCSKLSFVNLKNSLHNSILWCKISFKRQQKHNRQGAESSHLPASLCRRPVKPSPTQQKFSAPEVHYNGFPGNNQWGNQWLVCVASAV